MERPDGRAQPCSADAQLDEDTPEEQCRQRVPGDIQRMIRKRIQTDEFVQRPKRCQNQRVIDGARARPDFGEAEWPDNHRILRQMLLIVPDITGVTDA